MLRQADDFYLLNVQTKGTVLVGLGVLDVVLFLLYYLEIDKEPHFWRMSHGLMMNGMVGLMDIGRNVIVVKN